MRLVKFNRVDEHSIYSDTTIYVNPDHVVMVWQRDKNVTLLDFSNYDDDSEGMAVIGHLDDVVNKLEGRT